MLHNISHPSSDGGAGCLDHILVESEKFEQFIDISISSNIVAIFAGTDDICNDLVILVIDLANKLLDDILEGIDALCTALLFSNNGKMNL